MGRVKQAGAMSRVVVVGTSSVGKSTLANALSAHLKCPCIELDALFWAPNWRQTPPELFKSQVAEAANGSHWVADGNYASVRDTLWGRADTIVWLNYSLGRVFWRGLKRAIRRSTTGEVLWHGNRESAKRTFLSRDSILLWILRTHKKRILEFERLRESRQYAHLNWLVFTHPSDAEHWLRGLREHSANAR